jgi:ATP-dependent RNA helicase DHX37/DHR1
MSATLRVSDFVENKTLFDNPVTIHFDRRTQADYVTQAIQKAIKIHSRLPAGGILIFLTGQQEIVGVCRKLEAGFGAKAIHSKKARKSSNMKRPLPPLFPQNETEDSVPLSKSNRMSERESERTALCSYLKPKQVPSRSKTLS